MAGPDTRRHPCTRPHHQAVSMGPQSREPRHAVFVPQLHHRADATESGVVRLDPDGRKASTRASARGATCARCRAVSFVGIRDAWQVEQASDSSPGEFDVVGGVTGELDPDRFADAVSAGGGPGGMVPLLRPAAIKPALPGGSARCAAPRQPPARRVRRTGGRGTSLPVSGIAEVIAVSGAARCDVGGGGLGLEPRSFRERSALRSPKALSEEGRWPTTVQRQTTAGPTETGARTAVAPVLRIRMPDVSAAGRVRSTGGCCGFTGGSNAPRAPT